MNADNLNLSPLTDETVCTAFPRCDFSALTVATWGQFKVEA